MTYSSHLLDLVRLADSALPVSAFAHSFGLETYIVEGRIRSGSDLRRFLSAELKLRVGSCDLPLMAQVYEAAEAKDLSLLTMLDEKIGALKHAREAREASLQMGRSLLELSLRVTPSALLEDLDRTFRAQEERRAGHYLTVFSCLAEERKIPIRDTETAYLYGYLNSRISVAVRLIPLGQTEGQKVLLSLYPLCEEILSEVEKQGEALSDFSGMDDIQMMRHENLESRIFRS